MFGTIKGKARQLFSQLLASQCYLKLCVCVCVCCEDLKILARNNTQHTKINCSCYKGNRCILNSFVFNFHYKICGLAVQLSGKAIASHTSPRFTLSSSSFFPGLSPSVSLFLPLCPFVCFLPFFLLHWESDKGLRLLLSYTGDTWVITLISQRFCIKERSLLYRLFQLPESILSLRSHAFNLNKSLNDK